MNNEQAHSRKAKPHPLCDITGSSEAEGQRLSRDYCMSIYYVCPLLFGINGLFIGDNSMGNLRSICVCMKCPQVKQLSWTFKAVWIRNYTNVNLSKAITLQSSVRQAQFYSLTVENKWIFQKNVLETLEIW